MKRIQPGTGDGAANDIAAFHWRNHYGAEKSCVRRSFSAYCFA